jgi:hypothetical protein
MTRISLLRYPEKLWRPSENKGKRPYEEGDGNDHSPVVLLLWEDIGKYWAPDCIGEARYHVDVAYKVLLDMINVSNVIRHYRIEKAEKNLDYHGTSKSKHAPDTWKEHLVFCRNAPDWSCQLLISFKVLLRANVQRGSSHFRMIDPWWEKKAYWNRPQKQERTVYNEGKRIIGVSEDEWP